MPRETRFKQTLQKGDRTILYLQIRARVKRIHASSEYVLTIVQRLYDIVVAISHLRSFPSVRDTVLPEPSRAFARSIFASGLHHSSDPYRSSR